MVELIVMEDRPEDSQVGQALEFLLGEANHVVELRNSPPTRDQFCDRDEETLWKVKSRIELVLSSIRAERESKPAHRIMAAE